MNYKNIISNDLLQQESRSVDKSNVVPLFGNNYILYVDIVMGRVDWTGLEVHDIYYGRPEILDIMNPSLKRRVYDEMASSLCWTQI